MVGDLYKQVLENKNIKDNLEYYSNLQKIKKEECEHLPVILGHSYNTKLYKNGLSENITYKKCLLCGQDLSMNYEIYEREFDASNFKKTEDIESYEMILKRYEAILNLFLELCHATSTKDELYEQFDLMINPDNYSKKLK